MDKQAIIDRLLDHYQHPHHHGKLDDAQVVMPGGNPSCGDTITIYLKIDETSQCVEHLAFEGDGCTVSQAAASILAEMMQNAPLEQIEEFSGEDMIDNLGRDVVASRPRCATLALNTLKTAVSQYRKTQLHNA